MGGEGWRAMPWLRVRRAVCRPGGKGWGGVVFTLACGLTFRPGHQFLPVHVWPPECTVTWGQVPGRFMHLGVALSTLLYGDRQVQGFRVKSHKPQVKPRHADQKTKLTSPACPPHTHTQSHTYVHLHVLVQAKECDPTHAPPFPPHSLVCRP